MSESVRPLRSRTVIFLHIPKTAGSTLHTIFNSRITAAESHGTFAASYDDEHAQALASLSDERKRAIKLLRGHQPFGMHRFLPQTCTYVTVLREPVARAISQFFYILKNPDNPLHDRVRKMTSPAEFVESGISVGMDNGQVRWLLGELRSLAFGEVGPVHVEQVKKNIQEHFALVGLTERFDESVLLLQRAMGWRTPPFYRSQNVNRKKASVDERQKEVIRVHNRYDIALYEYAEKLLEAQLSAARLGARDVARFGAMNRMYGRLRWPQDMLPERVKELGRRLRRSSKSSPGQRHEALTPEPR